MIIFRKYFSEEDNKTKLSPKDLENLYKTGAVAGTALVGAGGLGEALRFSANRIKKHVITPPNEEAMRILKRGRYIAAAGIPIAGYSIYKYKKIKKDKNKKDDNSKA